jgi:hypothetical protein
MPLVLRKLKVNALVFIDSEKILGRLYSLLSRLNIQFIILLTIFFFCMVLGMEPGAMHMLGKCSTATDIHPQSLFLILCFFLFET